jgi:hypothetical protein
VGRADDCNGSCCVPIPTLTPGPECGTYCVPDFVKVGNYFTLPGMTTVWHVVTIKPSGWVYMVDDTGTKDIWINLAATPALVPVFVATAQ